MPFKVQTFSERVEQKTDDTVKLKLAQACEAFTKLSTSKQKAHGIQELMDILDRELSEATRWEIMEACGRQCIGASVLEKARRFKNVSTDIDDLLDRLNQAHIGGGHLRREGNVIHASYDRCYCGSVSQSRGAFSDTYCHCSCGWYQQLFESLLDEPVKVELLGSILQGAERCEFLIRYQA